MTNFTIDEILQFINNELPAEKKTAFQLEFEKNLELRQQYENLLSTSTMLTKHSLSPDQRSIERILKYANKTTTANYC